MIKMKFTRTACFLLPFSLSVKVQIKNNIKCFWATKGSHGVSGEGYPLRGNQISLAPLSDWLDALK